ncbi:MAG: TonB-dependent receptor [Flavobacteriales bacterium]|nr:TonB-dependent receptor [Flavobacteriales bacterium]
MRVVRPLFCVCAFAVVPLVHGQLLRDTVPLRAFEVTATRLEAVPGSKVIVVDSATMARYSASDLGGLLAGESPVFVKSYGLGSLAVTSFRGGGAGHTAVLWNGFNINSPMNGQLDLSLVPIAAMQHVAVLYGGGTALWGSGAIGGTILLNDLPRFDDGIRVNACVSLGSFSDQRQQVRVQRATKKFVLGIGAYNSAADNDFPLPSADDAAMGRQTNAAFAQRGLVGDAHVRAGRRDRLGMHVWLQESDRQVPPSVESTSTAFQRDESVRLAADWQHTTSRTVTTARAGWSGEQLDWYATDASAVARSRSRTLIAEVETRVRLNARHHLHVGLNHTYASASSDGLIDDPTQVRDAIFSAHRYTSANERFTSSLSARQELLDGDLVPFTCSIGGEYAVRRWLKLKAQGSKLYRVPTLNDRYWLPGGDPDLRSEQGYSGDLGAQIDLSGNGIRLTSEVTFFDRLIDDWIQWMPGPSYWSPRNILQVWSRGVETTTTVRFNVHKVGVELGVLTNHVVSSNRIATSANDASVGKQLILVPMYSGHAKLGMAYKGLSFTGLMRYTGYRYTSTDNHHYLEPFWLANAWLSYRLPTAKRCTVNLQFQCDNLFDEVYQVMLNRPMPLRSYRLGINVAFHRPNRP